MTVPTTAQLRAGGMSTDGTEPGAVRVWPEDAMASRFADDTADHAMTVMLDEGLHRHLKLRKPGTGMYWYEVVTWPGALAIRGDMGSFVFSRLDDMFEFFRGQRVNPIYWAEKEITGAETKRFDLSYAERIVREHVEHRRDDFEPDDFARIEEAVGAIVGDFDFAYNEGVHTLLRDLRVDLPSGSTFEFYDTWEWDLTDWTAQYLWCCHAIVAAIRQYDEAKS